MKSLRNDLEELCKTTLNFGNWLELDISSPDIQNKINEIVEKYELLIPKLRFEKIESAEIPQLWEIIRDDGSIINGYYIAFENNKFTSNYLEEDVETGTFEEICEFVQQAYMKCCKEAFEDSLI